MRITVVGGGILGASAALALAQDSHQVTLVERGSLGSASTAKAAGILSTMTWNDDDYRLIATTRGLIGETISLAMSEGARAARGAWKPVASLAVADAHGAKALDAMADRLERMTEEPQRLAHREAAREFPGVTFAPGEEALVAQEDGVVEAGDLFLALRTRLEGEGARVLENVAVPPMACTSAEAHVTVPGHPEVGQADVVVVAGGSWTSSYLGAAGLRLPVQNYRTQLANLELGGAGELPIVHDLVRHFYTRPESDGTFLAGNGTQLRPFAPDDYNEAADPEFLHSVAQRVVARFERGAEARLRRGWAGLCVATPDRRPLCGPLHPSWLQGGHATGQAVPSNLFVLTGDNGFGLMRGLALGARLADAVAGRVHPATDPRRLGAHASASFEMREGYGDLGPALA